MDLAILHAGVSDNVEVVNCIQFSQEKPQIEASQHDDSQLDIKAIVALPKFLFLT